MFSERDEPNHRDAGPGSVEPASSSIKDYLDPTGRDHRRWSAAAGIALRRNSSWRFAEKPTTDCLALSPCRLLRLVMMHPQHKDMNAADKASFRRVQEVSSPNDGGELELLWLTLRHDRTAAARDLKGQCRNKKSVGTARERLGRTKWSASDAGHSAHWVCKWDHEEWSNCPAVEL